MNLLERVEVYSSYTYAVEPRAFYLQGARHLVQKVLRMWKSPGRVHFLASDENRRLFELIYDETDERWFIESGPVS